MIPDPYVRRSSRKRKQVPRYGKDKRVKYESSEEEEEEQIIERTKSNKQSLNALAASLAKSLGVKKEDVKLTIDPKTGELSYDVSKGSGDDSEDMEEEDEEEEEEVKPVVKARSSHSKKKRKVESEEDSDDEPIQKTKVESDDDEEHSATELSGVKMEDLQTGKVALSTKIATELQKLDKNMQERALQGIILRIKKQYGMDDVVVKFHHKSGQLCYITKGVVYKFALEAAEEKIVKEEKNTVKTKVEHIAEQSEESSEEEIEVAGKKMMLSKNIGKQMILLDEERRHEALDVMKEQMAASLQLDASEIILTLHADGRIVASVEDNEDEDKNE